MLATDFFDASINRIAAYVIGLRAVRKAILHAMLDPSAQLARLEREGCKSARLALMEQIRTLRSASFGSSSAPVRACLRNLHGTDKCSITKTVSCPVVASDLKNPSRVRTHACAWGRGPDLTP
jgi:hypothetical protein